MHGNCHFNINKFSTFIERMNSINTSKQPILYSKNLTIPYAKTPSFLKKQPDFYLFKGGVKYPAHRQFLKKSQFLQAQILCLKESVWTIPETIDTEALFHILYYMYTQQIKSLEISILGKLITALRILEVKQMQRDLSIYIQNNLDKFRLLMLFNTAFYYQEEQIMEIVRNELIAQDFKQLKQSRDIYQMGRQSFIKIIKSHNEIKTKIFAKGCSNQDIAQIIKSYQQINNCSIQNQIYENGKNPEEQICTFQHLKRFKDYQQNLELSNQFNQLQQIKESSTSLQVGQVLYNKPSITIQKVERDKIHEIFMNLDLVASPIMNDQEFDHPNITFDDWGLNQNNKFLTIQTKDQEWISQESSNQGDQSDQETSRSPSSRKPHKTKCIPQISKHFVV